MEKITYGAPRLVDWVAQIKAGAATVRVHFTGGALTSYGVTPAEYTTANPFIQKVIEQSKYFKEGRITKLRSTTIPDSAKPVIASKTKAKQARKQIPEEQVTTHEAPASPHLTEAPANTGLSDEASDAIKDATDVVDEHQDAQIGSNGETIDDGDNGGIVKVEASCLQDAQAYLQEHFNIASYKVRSYDAAQKVASEHGVQFVGAKFDTLKDEEQDHKEVTEVEE